MEDMKVSKLKLKKGDGSAPSAIGADVGDIKVARGANARMLANKVCATYSL